MAEWIVVVEAKWTVASSVDIAGVRRIMEAIAHRHPTTLYSPQRYALQVVVEAPTSDEALRVALADWRWAEESVGIEPAQLTRAEVISAEEFERERRSAAVVAGTTTDDEGCQQAVEDRLLRQAFHDPLTGVANAELFLDHLQHAVQRASRNGTRLALILCDIDDFRCINHRFGCRVADEVLVEVADRLKGALRPNDGMARIGSDDFAILIEDTSAVAATRVGQRLVALAAPFPVEGQEVPVSLSLGIALSEPGQGIEELMENARSAQRAAQQRGGGSWELFDHGAVTIQVSDVVQPRPQRPDNVACLRLLQRAAMAANECETLEEAARIVLQQVCGHTGWSVGHLYVVREGTVDRLVSSGIWYISSPERFADFRTVTEAPESDGRSGLPDVVLETGRSAWIADISGETGSSRTRSAAAAGLRAGFAFPVLTGDEVVGVLEFYADFAVEADDALSDVMTSVGTQLGRVVERDRAAAALRRSEERFRTSVASIPGAVIAVRPDGTVAEWLGGAERMFLYSDQEVVGEPLAKLLPDLFPPGIRPEARLAELVDQTVEVGGVRIDGERLVVEVSVTVRRGSDRPLFTAMVRDVTERHRAESDLRRREGLFRALLQNSSDMVSVLDPDGTLRLYFGPRVLGYAEGEKVGAPVWDLLHPDDLDGAAGALRELLSRPGLGPRPIELRVRHADGSWRWMEVVASNLLDHPDIEGVVLNSRDVTERKLLEQALDDVHAELEAAQALAGLGRWRVVDDENTRAWSRSMYDLFGCDPSQPAPDVARFLLLVHPDDRRAVAEDIRRVRSGEPRFAEFRVVDPGGGLRRISSWTSPLRDVDGCIVGLHGVANDSTQRTAGLDTVLDRVSADPSTLSGVAAGDLTNPRPAPGYLPPKHSPSD